jgi:hypothetical protein
VVFNPEFAVAIYYGLQILAATLVYCFYHPVLHTGPQRETIGTLVPYLFHPPDETKLPVARVVVCDTIFFLTISIDMPASQKRSNCAFRFGLRRLATMPTAKTGLNQKNEYRNTKQIRNANVKCSKHSMFLAILFGILCFDHLNLFRASDF